MFMLTYVRLDKWYLDREGERNSNPKKIPHEFIIN